MARRFNLGRMPHDSNRSLSSSLGSTFTLLALALASRPAHAQDFAGEQPASSAPASQPSTASTTTSTTTTSTTTSAPYQYYVPPVSPAGSSENHRGGTYVHAFVGGGYGHYWQIGGADRDAGGGLFETALSIGYAMTDRFAVGAGFIYEMYFGMQVNNHVSGSVRTVPFSPAGAFGLTLAFAPGGREGRFALETFLGLGGGGGDGRWGGFGAIATLAPTLRLFNAGRSHVGIGARLLYGQLWWSDNSAVRPLISLTVGLDWAAF